MAVLVAAGPAPARADTLRQETVAGYARDGYQLHPLPGGVSPTWRSATAPRVDPQPHDEQGVRLFNWQGNLVDHPVVQVTWGFENINAYELTHDQFFLDRAAAQAQRNLDRRVESRGAWWYPYGFDLPRCGTGRVLTAPWFSGMAQGLLLSLFVRLYGVTDDPKWREAADRTLDSLTLGPDPDGPWVTWVDPDGYLWLDEYPDSPPGVRGEQVFNGMIYASYGVYDYWRLTGDPRAVALFDGTATTVRRYVPTGMRVPGWASRYGIGCPVSYANYHQDHTVQMTMLHRLTHAGLFAAYADVLRADYPYPVVSGRVVFEAGVHVGYRFDSAGQVVASKTMTLGRASMAHTDQRVRVRGRDVHYRIVDGALAGYLVAEEPGRRWLAAKVVEHLYTPTRLLAVEPGTYTGHTFDAFWNVTGSKTVTFPRQSSAPLGASAVINGELHYRVTAGTYVGFWLPARAGLWLPDVPASVSGVRSVDASKAAMRG
ncbi:D-glucuronyl C5-epimerase family protein [Micromonospora sp. CA-244673]|uniref:D-glucuronyl C5-epimerase family protein n=1 Tax=Micromonospora sp. CA-244673 TaxID=3239958 RepID=UPI003D8A3DEB